MKYKGFSITACFLAHFLNCSPLKAKQLLENKDYLFLDTYKAIDEFKQKMIHQDYEHVGNYYEALFLKRKL